MTDTPSMIHPKYRTGCILRGIRNFFTNFLQSRKNTRALSFDPPEQNNRGNCQKEAD